MIVYTVESLQGYHRWDLETVTTDVATASKASGVDEAAIVRLRVDQVTECGNDPVVNRVRAWEVPV